MTLDFSLGFLLGGGIGFLVGFLLSQTSPTNSGTPLIAYYGPPLKNGELIHLHASADMDYDDDDDGDDDVAPSPPMPSVFDGHPIGMN